MLDKHQFLEAIAHLPHRKVLPDSVYLHKSALETDSPGLFQFVSAVGKALKIPLSDWNIAKLGSKEFRLSLLHYPRFEQDAYPALAQSISVDLTKLTHRVIQYDQEENTPILHRKETMVRPDHPQIESFKLITQEGEAAGLYENSRMIGFKQSWERLIARHGYELVDGRLFRASSFQAPEQSGIDRHRTAIVRHELSTPLKALARHGYLSGDFSIFDYGCGRGDDMRELEAHGLDVLGWDPNFRPEGDKVASDIVNIGFVINVIEDPVERIEAVAGAWELTEKLLVVSAMLASEEFVARFRPYKDGVITSRNTFQKYYNQAELQSYIERTLDESAIAVGPGVFYVFRDKVEEQRFLEHRQRRKHQWTQLTAPKVDDEDKARLLLTTHKPLFDAFWIKVLTLGRLPANDEFEESEQLRKLCGSHRKALAIIERLVGGEELKLAKQSRIDDLLVYFALNLFGKRKPYVHMPEDLKRDIKAFFGSYKEAQGQASEALYSIADTELIEAACLEAHRDLSASILNDGHSLILHKSLAPDLPPLLRIYVGAATQLYGELEDIDLVKVHITSGKVSLMGYEGFCTSPLPRLRERVKIKMAEQEVDFFDYMDESKRPPLLNKSALTDDSFADHSKQQGFDKRARELGLLTVAGEENITAVELQLRLQQAGKVVKGYRFFERE
ncbi:DNA phosphorothioation-associated putative methyltransferase [Ferrimonas balearica]|uniref:DNA phosphorothioation-associated putative methyltransferase n=1 Tax=Ferrimonas balearica TaxID=44012 RepID=UPI001C990FF7|nr:DNA phosphorothioation-associated putative methyltransferase [Ferrimonas balearica]MBY5993688.1 DNA phosphorothioation-associated putative methyltransferase [Ferrimonas balearica]